jgi:hypothetical protein
MGEIKRLLVVAGDAAGSAEEVPAGVRAVLNAAAKIFVVTPTLPGSLHWLVSDTDAARKEADGRLQAVLGQLAEAHLAAAGGEIGADDPLVAIEDHVRSFGPDHLLIALRSADDAGWQERGLLDAIHQSFRLPMTVFTIGG